MLSHAFIHALVTTANQQQLGACCVTAGRRLREERTLRRQQDDPLTFRQTLLAGGGKNRLHRLEDGRGLHQHPGPAAKTTVIDGAMPIMGPLAQIMDGQVELAGITRPRDDAVRERPRKEIRKDRQQVKAHAGLAVQVPQTFRKRHVNALLSDVDGMADLRHKRNHQATGLEQKRPPGLKITVHEPQ